MKASLVVQLVCCCVGGEHNNQQSRGAAKVMDGRYKSNTAAGNESINNCTMVGAAKCGCRMTQQQQTTRQPTIIRSVKSWQRLATRVTGND